MTTTAAYLTTTAVCLTTSIVMLATGCGGDGAVTDPGSSNTSELATTLEVEPASATLAPGDSVQIRATPRDADGIHVTGYQVTWSSEDPGIAAVDEDGTVTGNTSGSTTVTATARKTDSTPDDTVSGHSNVSVEVGGGGGDSTRVASVDVSPDSASVPVGDSVQYDASVTDAGGNPLDRSVSWSSTDTSVASVDEAGMATARSEGTTLITASSEGVADTASLGVTQPAGSGDAVPVWGRASVSVAAGGVPGNPFEVPLEATFTHRASGTALTMPGYYAGSDTFRINFMPTRAGEWSYRTSSAEPALDGLAGTVTAEASNRRGLLRADPVHPRKWKFADGPYVIPIALRMEFFAEPASLPEFEAAARVLAEHNVHMMETRLTEEEGMFEGGRHDFIFQGDWRDHQFDLDVWDRMQRRMDALAARGLGAHIMFYSDGGGVPGWSGQSETERLVIRYAVARLAPYPVVFWNTGIDIAEFRSQSDIDWMGQQLAALDPYDHPRSSRQGGGSGSMEMASETFESWGDPNRTLFGDMLEHWKNAEHAVSFDDAWGENRPSHPAKNHTPADIRRGSWKSLLAGGAGFLIRGGGDGLPVDGYYSIHHVESDWESEQWLQLVNPFLQEHLGDSFPEMQPAGALAGGTGVHALATPDRRQILYLTIGPDDSYDDDGGGNLSLELDGLNGTWTGTWFDPRNGSTSDAGPFDGGRNHSVTPPSPDDWILLLNQR